MAENPAPQRWTDLPLAGRGIARGVTVSIVDHSATQANVETRRSRGAAFVGPMEGRLATGRMGAGRLAETQQVIGALRALLGTVHGDLAGRRIVVSAGGTQEPIDPV